MKVALMFKSEKICKDVIARVKNISDGIEYSWYTEVDFLIKDSNMKRIYFDRILISDSAIQNSAEESLSKLNKYISEESDKTQIVLISSSYSSEVLKLFKEVFNSPLYTALVPKATSPKELTSFISMDLGELTLRYFDEAKFKAEKDKAPVQQEKKSGGLFSKKSAENQEGQRGRSDRRRNRDDRANNGLNENQNFAGNGTGNSGFDSSNRGLNSEVSGSNNNQKFENMNSNPSGVDTSYQNPENGQSSLDDLLNAFDSGEEITENEPQAVEEVEEEVEDSKKTFRERTSLDVGETAIDVASMSKIAFFIGERGVGVTTLVTDIATSLYERGESVLIVDLDYIRNGILSNIDVKDFYAKGKDSGIDNKNVYKDDEVDILSNGYAVPIAKPKLRQLFSDRLFINNYDRILVDCPLDCLKSLSWDIINRNSIYIIVKGDLLSLSATSMGLTDKSIDSAVERYIAENCQVHVLDLKDTFEDDIAIVRDTMYFSNGNWLNKIAV